MKVKVRAEVEAKAEATPAPVQTSTLTSTYTSTFTLPPGVPPLQSFYIYLSDNCNLRCRHCWIVPRFQGRIHGFEDSSGPAPNPGILGSSTPRPLSSAPFVDLDALRGAVREAKTLGLNSAKLTGGEPMLHPRFMGVVDALTAEELSLSMETNGTLLTTEAARYLKDKTNLTFISISLDGPDARTHDAFRGMEGAFDAALNGLSYLRDAGYKNTQVIMSVHRGNRAQVEAVVTLAATHGAASVKLNPVNRTGRGTAMHERGEAMDFDEQMELARYIDDDLGPRATIDVILSMPPALSSLRRLRRTSGSCGDCGVRGILGILAGRGRSTDYPDYTDGVRSQSAESAKSVDVLSGSGQSVESVKSVDVLSGASGRPTPGVYALCGIGSTCPEFVYGQLGRDSVRDIWLTNPTVLHLRRALADVDAFPGICARCILARVCRTGCVADNYVQDGQLIAPNWMCAEAVRRGVFPPARAQRRSTQGDE